MFGSSKFTVYHKNGFDYIKISENKSGADDLIFLHGMFGGLSNYDELIQHIDGFNIYVPSIPIYDFDRSDLSIRNLTQWVHNFCEMLEIPNPVLVGNSMGGHMALEYALQYSDHVKALVLTGSSGLQEKDFGSSCPRRNDREYIRKQAEEIFYGDLVNDTILDEIMGVIRNPVKLGKMLTIARDTHEYNMEQYLSQIEHEVLLIWGKNDKVTPPSVAHTLHQKLPHVQLRWIDKCGHAPMMEHPQTFALFLNEFLIELRNKRITSTDYEENCSHF
ncbi:MAG TPA: alpha/beta hydrolase [Balneolaceae bacterium]|nr:alpha/beta hydrolase [Balneolaceae bacterium]